jgi:hypothetical protein
MSLKSVMYAFKVVGITAILIQALTMTPTVPYRHSHLVHVLPNYHKVMALLTCPPRAVRKCLRLFCGVSVRSFPFAVTTSSLTTLCTASPYSTHRCKLYPKAALSSPHEQTSMAAKCPAPPMLKVPPILRILVTVSPRGR